MEVQKGTIQTMSGATCTVIPSTHPDIVTQPLVVPFYWRETMGNLQAGEEVYFFEDDQHGGYIIGRTDGNWDNILRGTLTVTEEVTAESTLDVHKDISTEMNLNATMNITANMNITSVAGDVKAGKVSLKEHIHPGDSGGMTDAPQK